MGKATFSTRSTGKALSGDSGIDLYQLASPGSREPAVRRAQLIFATVALEREPGDPASAAAEVLAALGIGARV